MGFLAPRTGHISSYSSRIDSPECPLQNRVLGFQYFFLDPKPPKMTGFCPKRAQKPPQKRSKMHQKGPTKRPQNGVKMRKKNDTEMGSKRCHNDAQTMPKWSLSNPKMTTDRPENGPKSPQNDLILVLFRSYFGPFWPFSGPRRLKMVKKGIKNWTQKLFKSHLHLHKSA